MSDHEEVQEEEVVEQAQSQTLKSSKVKEPSENQDEIEDQNQPSEEVKNEKHSSKDYQKEESIKDKSNEKVEEKQEDSEQNDNLIKKNTSHSPIDRQEQQSVEQITYKTKQKDIKQSITQSEENQIQPQPLQSFQQVNNKKTLQNESKKQLLESAYGKQPKMRKTQSSVFIRTPENVNRKIVHDQINSSHSKQMFTFSKATRFSKPREGYCSTQFYDSQLQTQLGQRSAGIGYGFKSDFTKTDKYRPGPTNYELPSCFERNYTEFKGVKFGYGRDEAYKMGPLGNMNYAPGPGTYEHMETKSTLKFSLGDRTAAKHIYLTSTTPAPGTYNVPGLDPKGNYYVGKYRSSGAAVFSPTSGHLFGSKRLKRQPGPGTYDVIGGINDGRTFLPSQFQTSTSGKFGIEQRNTQQLPLLKTPGPGAYSIPSEFGDIDFPALPDLLKKEEY